MTDTNTANITNTTKTAPEVLGTISFTPAQIKALAKAFPAKSIDVRDLITFSSARLNIISNPCIISLTHPLQQGAAHFPLSIFIDTIPTAPKTFDLYHVTLTPGEMIQHFQIGHTLIALSRIHYTQTDDSDLITCANDTYLNADAYAPTLPDSEKYGFDSLYLSKATTLFVPWLPLSHAPKEAGQVLVTYNPSQIMWRFTHVSYACTLHLMAVAV